MTTPPDDSAPAAGSGATPRPHVDDHAELAAENARSGLWLFAIYLAVYAGFMGLNAFSPRSMGQPVLAGVNLAIMYGFGLILGAFVLAMVYMLFCKLSERKHHREGGGT